MCRQKPTLCTPLQMLSISITDLSPYSSFCRSPVFLPSHLQYSPMNLYAFWTWNLINCWYFIPLAVLFVCWWDQFYLPVQRQTVAYLIVQITISIKISTNSRWSNDNNNKMLKGESFGCTNIRKPRWLYLSYLPWHVRWVDRLWHTNPL